MAVRGRHSTRVGVPPAVVAAYAGRCLRMPHAWHATRSFHPTSGPVVRGPWALPRPWGESVRGTLTRCPVPHHPTLLEVPMSRIRRSHGHLLVWLLASLLLAALVPSGVSTAAPPA